MKYLNLEKMNEMTKNIIRIIKDLNLIKTRWDDAVGNRHKKWPILTSYFKLWTIQV
jgi:hypothetical protein